MLFSALRARRSKVALGLVAVTLGVGVATTLATLALEVGDDLARTLRAAGPNFVVLPAGARMPVDVGGAEVAPARAGLALPDTAVAELKRTFWRHNILEAAPELMAPVRLEGMPVTLVGTWFERHVPGLDDPWRTGLAALRPHWALSGRWPRAGAGEIVLGNALAERLGLGPGARAEVSAGGRDRRWLVTGILTPDGSEASRAWAPLAEVQQLAGRRGELDRIWLSALVSPSSRRPPPDPSRDPKGYERYMCTPYPGNIASDLGSRMRYAEVVPMTEALAGEATVVVRLGLLVLLLALAALAASALGLFSTTMAAVVERHTELGLLRALGATSRQIAMLLIGETGLVSLGGGLLGWTLGTLGAAAIRGETFGATSVFSPLLLPLALLLSIGVGIAGTIGPLRLALEVEPTMVLRG